MIYSHQATYTEQDLGEVSDWWEASRMPPIREQYIVSSILRKVLINLDNKGLLKS